MPAFRTLSISLLEAAPLTGAKAVAVVDELPRNTMGKLQKAELRVTYAGKFEGE
ncbi:hypothetical protein [Flavisphingopyxis soli]|uniref:hypothetical protein n=1 Tax=Flavisphingopyxis soli TaxID=2601267 RepID=UPI001375792E|nr:hypothetical protein [Sphingorhabdus soli]